MDKLLFILNPVAGGGRARNLISIIEEKMKKNEIDYEMILTTKPKEAIKMAEEAKNNTIIAVGGDGTVNEVAKGLINRGTGVLGIIPGGTGNDMCRSLGLSMDPNEAIETIIKGKTKEMDLGTANGYFFLNIASVGFDAEVVRNTDKIKHKIKGKMAYVLGVIITLLNFKKKDIELEIDGNIYKKRMVLLAVGNGKYYGGGMKILPMAKIDDGYLYTCLVKDISNFKILFLFPSIFSGNHLKFTKYIEVFKAKSVKIRSKKGFYLNLDGDVIPIENEVDFKMNEKKLQIIYE